MSLDTLNVGALTASVISIGSLILPVIKEYYRALIDRIKSKPSKIVIHLRDKDGNIQEIQIEIPRDRAGLSEDAIDELNLKIGKGETIKFGDGHNGEEIISK